MRTTMLIVILIGLTGCKRPFFLTRETAAQLILNSAQFQHKTKLIFDVAENEAAIPGACHNFQISPHAKSEFDQFRSGGFLQFSKFGNQVAPFSPPRIGSLALSSASINFLIDTIDKCIDKDLTELTGSYELSLGQAQVDVTGIVRDGNTAKVDFVWHFIRLNDAGSKILPQLAEPQIDLTREQSAAKRLDQKPPATPHWDGSAELVRYDDGWRVTSLFISNEDYRKKDSDFGLAPRWNYGPEWPDPDFNWKTADEDENHY